MVIMLCDKDKNARQDMLMNVSIIIVNYNTKDLLKDCIYSIINNVKNISYEIIVVDNASQDGSIYMVRSLFSDVKLIINKTNTGFGSANNIGVEAAEGKYIFFFNSDAILVSDTVFSLFDFLEKNQSYAMAGPKILLPGMTMQPKTCGELPTIFRIFNDSMFLSILLSNVSFFDGINTDKPSKKETSLGWISGVCMLIRKDVFESVGGFDKNIFLYSEDMDLCRRIKDTGWEIAHIDDFPIIHKCGGSSKTDADIIRNSVLQQNYFLEMLTDMFSHFQMVMVRSIMFKGLILRILIGAAIKIIKPEKKSLLMETSLARIKRVFRQV